MVERRITTNASIGYAKIALELKKAAKKKHRENRNKAFRDAGRNALELKKSLVDAIITEVKNPWNLFIPLAIYKAGLMTIKGTGAVLGYLIDTPIELIKKRKESILMKKSTVKMVGYALLEEMQRDSALKKTISNFVKDDELKWLYISSKGEIILTDKANYPKAKLENKYFHNDPPRVDMEALLKRANETYHDMDSTPYHTMASLKGNTLTISQMNKGRSEANLVRTGVKKAKDTEKSQETILNSDLLKIRIMKSGIPDKLKLKLFLKNGTIREIIIKKEEAIKIFKQMRKR